MHILPTARFRLHLRKLAKRNPQLADLIDEKIQQFSLNPKHPLFRVHKLSGYKEETWSFSVGYDLRILFTWEDNTIVLVDIGTHDVVY